MHHDIRKDVVFCYHCMKYDSKLIAKHNNQRAYISNGFRNWKKSSQYFRDHEATSCQTVAFSDEVLVPTYRDVADMNKNEVVKCRYKERQYVKVILECLLYLARQEIPLRENKYGNDNLT